MLVPLDFLTLDAFEEVPWSVNTKLVDCCLGDTHLSKLRENFLFDIQVSMGIKPQFFLFCYFWIVCHDRQYHIIVGGTEAVCVSAIYKCLHSFVTDERA